MRRRIKKINYKPAEVFSVLSIKRKRQSLSLPYLFLNLRKKDAFYKRICRNKLNSRAVLQISALYFKNEAFCINDEEGAFLAKMSARKRRLERKNIKKALHFNPQRQYFTVSLLKSGKLCFCTARKKQCRFIR